MLIAPRQHSIDPTIAEAPMTTHRAVVFAGTAKDGIGIRASSNLIKFY
jgi:hypothetical protein